MSDVRMKVPSDWTFKSLEVASHFDQHVTEQLPWYKLITRSVVVIARHYIGEKGLVYDIGCSTGNITRAIHESVKGRGAKFVGIDNSKEMEKFFPHPIASFECADACEFEYEPFDLAVCYLTLQFTPLEKRQTLVEKLRASVKPSGAIIIVDKFIDYSGYCFSGEIFRRMTLNGKKENGTPADEIVQKELSICGIQRPVNPSLITNLSPLAFEFFRFGEFAGWVIPATNE